MEKYSHAEEGSSQDQDWEKDVRPEVVWVVFGNQVGHCCGWKTIGREDWANWQVDWENDRESKDAKDELKQYNVTLEGQVLVSRHVACLNQEVSVQPEPLFQCLQEARPSFLSLSLNDVPHVSDVRYVDEVLSSSKSFRQVVETGHFVFWPEDNWKAE